MGSTNGIAILGSAKWKHVSVLLAAVICTWFVTFFPELSSIVHLWNSSDTYVHGYVVYPICIYFIWTKRAEIADIPVTPNVWVIIPILLVLMLWLAGKASDIQLFVQAAAVMILPLLIWMIVGNSIARTIWFPLAFSLFAVPFGDELVPMLQRITADASVALIKLVGIPVEHEGLYIKLSSGLFEVAEACSGVRYLTVTLFISALYAYNNFHKWYKWVGFAVVAVVVPIIANSLRAFGIIMIAHYTKMEYAVGVDHLIYGWIFFGLVVVIIFYIGHFWREETQKLKDTSAVVSETFASRNNKAPTLFVPFSLAAMVFLIIIVGSYQLDVDGIKSDSQLQTDLLNNSFVPLPSSLVDAPVFQNPNDVYVGRLRNNANIDIYIAQFSDYNDGKELINWGNKIYDEDKWSLDSSNTVNIDIQSASLAFKLLDLRSIGGERKRILYWYQIKSGSSIDLAEIKIKQAIRKLSGDIAQGTFIALIIRDENLSETQLRKLLQHYYSDIKLAVSLGQP